MTEYVYANEASSESQFRLKTTKDEPIIPYVISRVEDEIYIVAGSAGDSAWATKVDRTGHSRWEYRTDFRDSFGYPKPNAPQYRGVASLPDGSFILCGDMPRPLNSGLASALLTHLDSSGRLINERLVTPNSDQSDIYHTSTFFTCMKSGNQIILFGIVKKQIQKDINTISDYYWISSMDLRGHKNWEKIIPLNFGFLNVLVPKNVSVMSVEHKIILSASDTNKTEVLELNEAGDLMSRRKLPGLLKLVQPAQREGSIQLIGLSPQNGRGRSREVLITLDTQLNAARSIDLELDHIFAATTTFRQQDDSIVSFGTGVYEIGQRYRCEILTIDGESSKVSRRILEDPSVEDAGQIIAAARSSKTDEYVISKIAIAKSVTGESRSDSGKKNTFKRGAAINFVNIKLGARQ